MNNKITGIVIFILGAIATSLNWISLIIKGKIYLVSSIFFPFFIFAGLAVIIDKNAFDFSDTKLSIRGGLSYILLLIGFVSCIINPYLMFHFK